MLTQALLGLIDDSQETPGVVVFLSSRLASLENNVAGGAASAASYRFSKAALNMSVRSFAAEHPSVGFVALSPGHVQTEMGTLDGRQPAMDVETSVGHMLTTLELQPSTAISGQFLNFNGEPIKW
jgi:NAD(P)-dependent dehydrogenase (short-subunit alcohol dehydrogenase family)